MTAPSRIARRTRVVVLAIVAIVCAVGAGSIVSGHEARIRAQVGPLVPVLVAAAPIDRDKRLTESNAATLLTQRRVPARFAPPGALRSPAQAVGYRSEGDLAAGDYVTAGGLISADASAAGRIGDAGGGRVVEVAVSGGTSVLAQLEPGSLVDVLVTSDRGGPPRTFLALQRVELVQAGGSSGDAPTSGGGGDRPADAVATLRVTLREAIMLTAAQNFAREIRLVPRPAGDTRSLSSAAVTAADLQP